MSATTWWKNYALKRGRVAHRQTGIVGELCDWPPDDYCKVFVGFDDHDFETWAKWDTQPVDNSFPVGSSIPQPPLSP